MSDLWNPPLSLLKVEAFDWIANASWWGINSEKTAEDIASAVASILDLNGSDRHEEIARMVKRFSGEMVPRA